MTTTATNGSNGAISSEGSGAIMMCDGNSGSHAALIAISDGAANITTTTAAAAVAVSATAACNGISGAISSDATMTSGGSDAIPIPSSGGGGSSSSSRSRMRGGVGRGVEEMWPALKNAVSLIAQHCPHFIQSCHLLHGDGGPGSIRLVKFGPASGLVTYAKEEILEVDEEKMVLTYLLLEGDLKKQFKLFKPSISLEKVGTNVESKEASQTLDEDHKCVAVWSLEYESQEGLPPLDIELLNEGAKMFFKLLESSVEASQAPTNATPSTHPPITEEPPTPLAV